MIKIKARGLEFNYHGNITILQDEDMLWVNATRSRAPGFSPTWSVNVQDAFMIEDVESIKGDSTERV